MAQKQARTAGLDRERIRRRKLDLLKSQETAARTEEVAEGVDLQAPAGTPCAEQGNVCPADGRPQVLSTTGVRLPGQHVVCGWCGDAVVVKSRGPIPKWCSATCRHRAWEQVRATNSGRVAVTVVDRCVTALPRDTVTWLDHLEALAKQVRGDDLDRLAIRIALKVVLAAVEEQDRRRSADDPW